jgi:hypothetical protein
MVALALKRGFILKRGKNWTEMFDRHCELFDGSLSKWSWWISCFSLFTVIYAIARFDLKIMILRKRSRVTQIS